MTDFFLQFAKALRFGKYTDWVSKGKFSKEQLKCLLWAVGEFNVSASRILELLWKHRAELDGVERAYLALVGIRNMALGERFCVDEWSRRLLDRRIDRQIADLPDPGRSALHRASPGVRWDIVMMIHEGYEVTGKDTTGQRLFAMLSTEGIIKYIGPARQRGDQPSSSIFSIFSAGLERELDHGLRTHWATVRTFTAEYLRCLLWMIGEFSLRSDTVFEILNREQAQLADHRRAVVALEAISLMVYGEWFDTDELVRRIDCGHARLEFKDVPEALRAAIQQATPSIIWNFVMMNPGSYTLCGQSPEGMHISADISRNGEVTLGTYISENQLPAPVLAKLREQAPEFRILWAYSSGPVLETIQRYEVLLERPGGDHQKFIVSADGLDATLEST